MNLKRSRGKLDKNYSIKKFNIFVNFGRFQTICQFKLYIGRTGDTNVNAILESKSLFIP